MRDRLLIAAAIASEIGALCASKRLANQSVCAYVHVRFVNDDSEALRAAFHGKRVAFVMHPEVGHILPTFALAKWLRSAGSTVLYLGPSDYQEIVEQEGIEYVRLIPDVAPRGYFEAWSRAKWAHARGGTEPIPPDLRTLLVGLVTTSQAEALIGDLRLDLLCADALLWPFVLVARKLGLPTVSLQTDGLRRFGRFALSFDAARRSAPVRSRWTASDAPSGEGPAPIDRAVAKAYGFPLMTGEDPADEDIWCIPELALGPRCLCLDPLGERPRSYLGLSLDLTRTQDELDEGQFNGKPIVYCSIGTNAHFYRTPERLLAAIVRALSTRADLQLVLHAGAHVELSHLPPLPEGALFLRRVPQLRILERASFFITHGGFGAVKEAIHFGVPMLVYPMWRDQFFNADTMMRLGVGIAGNALGATSGDVASGLGRLVHGPYREAIGLLRGQIAAANELERGVSLLADAIRAG